MRGEMKMTGKGRKEGRLEEVGGREVEGREKRGKRRTEEG